MKFIPFSYYGGGEFSGSMAVRQVGPSIGTTSSQFREVYYKGIGYVDAYITGSIPLQNLQNYQLNTSNNDTCKAPPFSTPFFSGDVPPNPNCKTYRFKATSSGPSPRYINCKLCGESTSISINMGNDPFEQDLMCDTTSPRTISGFTADSSVTLLNNLGYDYFVDSLIPNSTKAYTVKFTSLPSAIVTNGKAFFSYIDVDGNIQNQALSGSSDVTLDVQTAVGLGFQGAVGITNNNLKQEIIKPANKQVTPYPYINTIRKYKIEQQQAANTYFILWLYSRDGVRYSETFGTPITSSYIYSDVFPLQVYGALCFCTDVSEWETISLYTSSLSTNICAETSSNTYYIGNTGSIDIGNTVYNDYLLTSNIGTTYLKELNSELYYLTDSTGTITTAFNCNPPSGMTSGSVINFANPNTGSYYTAQFTGPTSLQNIQNTGVTLEIWGKNPVGSVATYQPFIGLWDGQLSPNRDWIEIRENQSTYEVIGDIYNEESPSFENKTTPSSAVANRSNWYHHMITFDTGSSVLSYYRNGSLEGTVSSSLDPAIYYQTVYVGEKPDGTTSTMYVGEYRVYTSSLDSSAVALNFNSTKTRYGY